MGTIPALPNFVAGQKLTAAELNEFSDVISFWALTPRALAYQSVAQSLPNNTYTALTLDSEVYDIVQSGDTPSHDNVTNNSRIYFRTTGKYEINAQVLFATNATGQRSIRIRKNAAGNPAAGTDLIVSNNGAISTFATAALTPMYEDSFVAGDYIELFAHQNSGVALNTAPTGQATFLRIRMTGQ